MKSNHINKLQQWIIDSIEFEYWKQYDDIHIDQIFRNPPKSTWLKKTISCFIVANSLLEKTSENYFVIATIPLDNYTEDPANYNLIKNLKGLEVFYEYTPPLSISLKMVMSHFYSN